MAPVLGTSYQPVGSANADADEVYGTFAGRTGVPTSPSPGRSKYGVALRAAGAAGVLLLAAGYLSQSSFSWTANVLDATTSDAAGALSDIESTLINSIDIDHIRGYLHKYSSIPHSAGTQQDYETAVYTAQQFESFGIKAELKEYYTLLSKPVRQRLAITEPADAARELNLTEASIPGDECTSDPSALPPFLAYAATGNVTASVVFVNFGKPEDFQWLLDHNVTLEGKIALVRYGGNFRGLKVMGAEQHGMIGTLIYSDPKEDGFVHGPVYPDGPWRPEDSFQRGSSQYLSLAGGDPLTPGFASVPGAPYLKYEDTKTIPHTPALPLSYGQAQHILRSLGGKKAPESWQGGLSFPDGYHVGDDEQTVVNLDIEIDNYVGAIWDVIGTIEGVEEPDQRVLLGNHRDAWVCGALDPNSGSSVLLEIARNLGKLLDEGWRPRRTLVLASWDGEEYGLLGSTEYAEDHAEVLKQQAVAYLNVDGFEGSLVSASASPAIAEFLFQTAKAVPANQFFGNETETTLYEQWTKQAAARRARTGFVKDGTLGPDHLIAPMGSGSDFTPYYQHLGIISANLGFSLTGAASGTYHSTMDSIPYSEKFADPRYATHATTARWWGLLGLRLADAQVLPFDFSTYGLVMDEDLAGFEAQVVALKHQVDFSKLHEAIAQFSDSAASFHTQLAAFADGEHGANAATRAEWNEKLVQLERHLLLDDGLPHRAWYKHVIFGPGFYEGYAGTAFPGISDAIAFEDDSETIQSHVDQVADVVRRAAEFLL